MCFGLDPGILDGPHSKEVVLVECYKAMPVVHSFLSQYSLVFHHFSVLLSVESSGSPSFVLSEAHEEISWYQTKCCNKLLYLKQVFWKLRSHFRLPGVNEIVWKSTRLHLNFFSLRTRLPCSGTKVLSFYTNNFV